MVNGELVIVRRRRRDWRTATYRLEDIVGLHLREHDRIGHVRGDLTLPSHIAMIHGYVRHEDMVGGELDHLPGDGHQQIRVCIARKDNTASAYRKVRARIRSSAPAFK